MRHFTRTMIPASAAALAMLGSVLAAEAQTAKMKDLTILKFSTPVEVPGRTLPAGEYAFQLADPDSSQHIVQVWNSERTDMLTQFHAIPMEREQATGDIVVFIGESRDADEVPALRGWFYPGARYGHEFVYPEDQAREIAQRTNKVVLSGDVAISGMQRGTVDLSGNEDRERTGESGTERAESQRYRSQYYDLDASGQRKDRTIDPVLVSEYWVFMRQPVAADGQQTASGTTGSRSRETVGTTGTSRSESSALDRHIRELEQIVGQALNRSSGGSVALTQSQVKELRSHIDQIQRLLNVRTSGQDRK